MTEQEVKIKRIVTGRIKEFVKKNGNEITPLNRDMFSRQLTSAVLSAMVEVDYSNVSVDQQQIYEERIVGYKKIIASKSLQITNLIKRK